MEEVLPFLSPKVCRVLECLREYAPATTSSTTHDSGCESAASNGQDASDAVAASGRGGKHEGKSRRNHRKHYNHLKNSGSQHHHHHPQQQKQRQQSPQQKKAVIVEVDEDEDEEEEEEEKEEAKAAESEAGSGGGGLCGIIFVEQRIVAEGLNKCLNHLKQMDSSLDYVKPRHLVGHALRDKGKTYDENFEKVVFWLRRRRRSTLDAPIVLESLSVSP